MYHHGGDNVFVIQRDMSKLGNSIATCAWHVPFSCFLFSLFWKWNLKISLKCGVTCIPVSLGGLSASGKPGNPIKAVLFGPHPKKRNPIKRSQSVFCHKKEATNGFATCKDTSDGIKSIIKSIESVAPLESEWQVWLHNIASDTQGMSVLGAFDLLMHSNISGTQITQHRTHPSWETWVKWRWFFWNRTFIGVEN